MKLLFAKLRASAGESLIETLAAVLIVSFSCLMLYSLTVAAVRINKRTAEVDTQIQAVLSHAEGQQGAADSAGTITITPLDPYDTNVYSKAVDYFGGAGVLTSYRLPDDEGGG